MGWTLHTCMNSVIKVEQLFFDFIMCTMKQIFVLLNSLFGICSAPVAFITSFVTLFALVIAITKDLPDVEGDRK